MNGTRSAAARKGSSFGPGPRRGTDPEGGERSAWKGLCGPSGLGLDHSRIPEVQKMVRRGGDGGRGRGQGQGQRVRAVTASAALPRAQALQPFIPPLPRLPASLPTTLCPRCPPTCPATKQPYRCHNRAPGRRCTACWAPWRCAPPTPSPSASSPRRCATRCCRCWSGSRSWGLTSSRASGGASTSLVSGMCVRRPARLFLPVPWGNFPCQLPAHLACLLACLPRCAAGFAWVYTHLVCAPAATAAPRLLPRPCSVPRACQDGGPGRQRLQPRAQDGGCMLLSCTLLQAPFLPTHSSLPLV